MQLHVSRVYSVKSSVLALQIAKTVPKGGFDSTLWDFRPQLGGDKLNANKL